MTWKFSTINYFHYTIHGIDDHSPLHLFHKFPIYNDSKEEQRQFITASLVCFKSEYLIYIYNVDPLLYKP